MSQPPDRRRPAGRPARRIDGPAGRGPSRGAGSAPPNRPFSRPGNRPSRFDGPRPERDRRDGDERGRGPWDGAGRRAPADGEPRGDAGRSSDGVRRVEGYRSSDRAPYQARSGKPAGAGWRERRPAPTRPEGRMPFPPRRGPDRFAPARPGRPLAPGRGAAMAKPSFAPPSADRPAEGENFAAAAPSDLIWGRHAAQAALESGRPVHRVWCTPEMRFSPRFLQLLREAKGSGALVEEVTWARLGQISGGAVHQGIVLQPAAAETLDLDGLLEGCRGIGEAPLLLAVDGLTDPQNLGAIVRSAEALGAHGLVLPQRRNAGLTGTVAKVAAGALEHLPIARVVNLNRSLDTLKQEGYRVIGLAAEGTVSLEEADLEGPLVLVTGSEGEGLSLLTRRHCDQLVRIPLRGTTPSLNASVATALLLYEVARRSWMRGLSGSAPAPRLVRPALPSPPLRPLAAPQEGVDPSDLAAGALLDGGPKPAGSAAEPKPERHPQVQPTALEGLDPASEPQPWAASPQPDGEPVLEPSAEAGEIQSLEQAPAELLAEPLALQPAEPPFHESQPAEPLASVPVLESSLGSAPLPSPDSSPGSLPPAQLQAAAPVDQVPGSAPGSASEPVPGSDAGTGPGAEPPAPVLAPPPADPWSEGVQGYEGASFSGDVRL